MSRIETLESKRPKKELQRKKRETEGNLGVKKKIHKRWEHHRADFRDTGKHSLITRSTKRGIRVSLLSLRDYFLQRNFPRGDRISATISRVSGARVRRKSGTKGK